MRTLPQPDRARIELPAVLDALSDPTRLAIVSSLAASRAAETPCASFLDLASKTNLTYHFAKLREAGLLQVRPQGRARLLSLRRADVEARFPGLLDSILAAARRPKRAASRKRAG